MADLPIDLAAGPTERLAGIIDLEAKIPRALDALGALAGRDVLLIGGGDGLRSRQLTELGARVVYADVDDRSAIGAADGSVDVMLSLWNPWRGVTPEEAAEAARVLRPGGRLLVLLDYGRDDVSRLRGDLPEYGLLSRRDGPFLRGGFKVRVVHCFWTFPSLDDAAAFLGETFGSVGTEVATGMRRPRLSYNVAVYHRTFGGLS